MKFVPVISSLRKFFLLSLLAGPWISCARHHSPPTWFKGNTHAHTTLCGHADTDPDSVAVWYLDRGYHFLILSEHNHFIDPDSVQLPTDRRSDFILIPGEEITGHKSIHTTAMNIDGYIEEEYLKMVDKEATPIDQLRQAVAILRQPIAQSKTEIIQRHTNSVLESGGLPILNHPNYQSGAQPRDILPVQHLHMLELYNGHPDVHNWGNDMHRSVEEKWDSLLTAGMLVLGISSDDAHHFKAWTTETSNPGRGWVMVNSNGVLTANSITAAMSKGRFYATNGVVLSEIDHDSSAYHIVIDTSSTLAELGSPYVTGKIEDQGKEGFVTSFIGKNGMILHRDEGIESTYKISSVDGYVRAKISYSRKRSDGTWESFFAWTQPQFLDERAKILGSGSVWANHTHE